MRTMKTFTVLFASLFAVGCSGTTSLASSSTGTSSGTSTGSSGSPTTTTVTGSSPLTFTPSFVGSSSTSGHCPACSGPPGSGTGSYPSGPPSYEALVVTLSNDPGLEGQCTADGGSYMFDYQQYHYLTVEVISTASVTPGTYAIDASADSDGGPAAFAEVLEYFPGTGAFADVESAAGSVVLTGLGSNVQGTFDVTKLYLQGSASSDTVGGAFDAPSCPALSELTFQTPCGGCPG